MKENTGAMFIGLCLGFFFGAMAGMMSAVLFVALTMKDCLVYW